MVTGGWPGAGRRPSRGAGWPTAGSPAGAVRGAPPEFGPAGLAVPGVAAGKGAGARRARAASWLVVRATAAGSAAQSPATWTEGAGAEDSPAKGARTAGAWARADGAAAMPGPASPGGSGLAGDTGPGTGAGVPAEYHPRAASAGMDGETGPDRGDTPVAMSAGGAERAWAPRPGPPSRRATAEPASGTPSGPGTLLVAGAAATGRPGARPVSSPGTAGPGSGRPGAGSSGAAGCARTGASIPSVPSALTGGAVPAAVPNSSDPAPPSCQDPVASRAGRRARAASSRAARDSGGPLTGHRQPARRGAPGEHRRGTRSWRAPSRTGRRLGGSPRPRPPARP
jgi:hypothetical protein